MLSLSMLDQAQELEHHYVQVQSELHEYASKVQRRHALQCQLGRLEWNLTEKPKDLGVW